MITWSEGWFSSVPTCALWVLCCLTVILGPPATFALVFCAQTSVHRVYPPVRALVEEGLRHFWLSWAWMLANIGVGGVLWLILHGFQAALPAYSAFAIRLIVVLAVLWAGLQFFTLPCLLLQERKNLILGLRNAVALVVRAPIYALIAAGCGLLLGAVSAALIAPLVLGGMFGVAVLANEAVFEGIKKAPFVGE